MSTKRDIVGWGRFLRQRYRDTRIPLWQEQFGPALCGVVAGALALKTGLSGTAFDSLVEHALPEAMTVAAIFAGFQATAQSVLLSMLDSPAWKVLTSRNADDRLIDYHWSAIWTLLAFVACCLVVICARAMEHDVTAWASYYPALLVTTAVWGAFSNWRIIRLMIRLLKNRELPTKKKQRQTPSGGVL